MADDTGLPNNALQCAISFARLIGGCSLTGVGRGGVGSATVLLNFEEPLAAP